MSMSTPTMLQTYDTQMMDYPSDIDVPMHSSNSDSWFLGEVAMEDDVHISKSHITDRFNATVEVDMEDWGGESIEYEMADEAETHYGGGDLVDVEVYDASQVHTPAAFDIDATRILPDGVSGHVLSSPALTPNVLTPMVSDNLRVEGEGHDHESIDFPEGALYSSVVEPSAAVSPLIEFRAEISNDVAAPAAIEPDSSPLPSTDIKAAFEDVSEPPISVNISDSDHHNAEYNEDPDAINPPEPQADHLTISDTSHVVLISHDSAEEFRQEHEHVHDHTESATDPHEISEGVYIDPPPAVLLSLSLPGPGEPLIYLFNPPLPQSGASSPSAAVEKSESSIILLHQRPTLYYEPLTSVFEALRQEEHIARIPGFADGELLIDAYDLQLSVTEDNTYAREVTLHDLNVLHDGSDFSGPLRLHLQCIVPRFILRYHLLQNQIASLNTAVLESAAGAQEEQKGHDHASVPAGEEDNSNELEQQLQEILHQDASEANVDKKQVIGEISNLPNEYLENQEPPEETSHLFDNPVGDREVATDLAEAEVEAETEDATAAPSSDGVGSDATSVRTEHPEYREQSKPPLETDRAYDDAPQEHGQHSTDYDEYGGPEESGTFEEAPHSSDGFAAPEFSTSHDAEQSAPAEYDEEPKPTSFEEQSTPDSKVEVLDTKEAIAPFHVDYVEQDGAELGSGPTSLLERQVEDADFLNVSSSVQPDKPSDIPEIYEDEWDDELDGEGEIDTAWELEHDAQSNESSVTLSSKASSSKRTYGEVEVDEEYENESLLVSSGTKRPRVQ